MPKKPISGFALYVTDRMPDLKKEKSGVPTQSLIKKIAEEWQEGKEVDQFSYIKKAEKDKRRFKKQLKEFQKFGYYTKTKEGKEDDDEDDNASKKSKKKKSTSQAGSQKTKKNKASSKSKTQERSRTRSKSKKSQKVGKSQKSKK